MGIFQDNIVLVNRAPVELTVTFDGQQKTLTPGDNIVPKDVVSFAKNQNPIMGTQNPNQPHMSGCKYLVGARAPEGAKQKDDIEPLSPAEWATHLGMPARMDVQALFDEEYGADPKAKLVTRGKGKPVQANSLYDDVKQPSISSESVFADARD